MLEILGGFAGILLTVARFATYVIYIFIALGTTNYEEDFERGRKALQVRDS